MATTLGTVRFTTTGSGLAPAETWLWLGTLSASASSNPGHTGNTSCVPITIQVAQRSGNGNGRETFLWQKPEVVVVIRSKFKFIRGR
jgi:hypothetical protein